MGHENSAARRAKDRACRRAERKAGQLLEELAEHGERVVATKIPLKERRFPILAGPRSSLIAGRNLPR